MLKVEYDIAGYDLCSGDIKVWKFPAGEVGVKVNGYNLSEFLSQGSNSIVPIITLDWESNDDLIALAQLVDILRNAGAQSIILNIPYFPYSRQDRRCADGEAAALKVVASFINSLNFTKVITHDAHSYVLENVVERLVNVPQHVLAVGLETYDFLIAPDAGAAKKIYEHGQVKDGVGVICAEKQRDSTGNIVRATINLPDSLSTLNHLHVCVVDDLCDGGATFLGLGKMVREKQPERLDLYVTHGIFTKGLDELLAVYDNIYVSNLMNKSLANQVKEI